uniref:FBD domain-containing protein n=1 Tax=Leersia perrieri TaxID=77586 RepID=A0A0D9WR68_9ORYZ
MSRRSKREVAPPPHTISSSSTGAPMPFSAPYPYGGHMFPIPPPPGWLASALSQAMLASSTPNSSAAACPPHTATTGNVHPDVEEWYVSDTFIFRRDFRCFPTFNKLKTLLLNEWCMAVNSSGLIYFLQHSPVLEKLTLQLQKYTLFNTGGMNKTSKEKFLASKHLKIVEIKYCEDEILQKSLQVLSACGIPSEKISIQWMSSWTSRKLSIMQYACLH